MDLEEKLVNRNSRIDHQHNRPNKIRFQYEDNVEIIEEAAAAAVATGSSNLEGVSAMCEPGNSIVGEDKTITLEDEGDECNFVKKVGDEFEIKVGMIFENEEEAYKTYNTYALSKGFGVRKGKKYMDCKGELRNCVYVCSREGFAKVIPPNEEGKFERVETRCGCPARIRFKIVKGVWEVLEISNDHNHPFVKEDQKHLIRSGRKITETSKDVLSSMTKVGIRATKAYSYLCNEVGGVQNVGFTLRDCQNFVQSDKSRVFSAGDAQTLINHFKTLQAQDPMFFYTVQVDEENRMTNFFWRDGLSKIDYDCFGDVIVFDSTYRTNKYNMICAPFVGVNHHWKNVFFGCAFLSDETINSYVWLFQSFLESMGNKAPKTIFTDQDQAMANATAKVFPTSVHRLCQWHICKNAIQNIPHLYGNKEFRVECFNKFLYGCENKEDFELAWKKMVEKWDVGENTWLNKLYRIREKWCPAFSRDVFSIGIRSTQRSESTNNVFQQMACKTMSLTEFVYHYEVHVSKMREAESQDDFSCANGKPKLRVRGNGILHQASRLYTNAIFKLFQDEFLQGISECLISSTNDGSSVSYTLKSENGQMEHVVRLDLLDNGITCSCKLFESKGWLCRHALRIYNIQINLREIPSQYILKRWTKDAKQVIVIDEVGVVFPNVAKSSKMVRLNKLMRKSFNIMSLCSNDDELMKLADTFLDKLVEQTQKYKRGSGASKSDNASDHEIPCFDNDEIVKDPVQKRSKGMTYGRLKSSLEKRKRKPSKVGASKQSLPSKSNEPSPTQMDDSINPVLSQEGLLNETFGDYNMYINYLNRDSTEGDLQVRHDGDGDK